MYLVFFFQSGIPYWGKRNRYFVNEFCVTLLMDISYMYVQNIQMEYNQQNIEAPKIVKLKFETSKKCSLSADFLSHSHSYCTALLTSSFVGFNKLIFVYTLLLGYYFLLSRFFLATFRCLTQIF